VTNGATGAKPFSPEGHGTAQQRVRAFEIGYDDGAAGCTSDEFLEAFPASPR
jgi:predicted metalloprotease